MSNRLSMLLFSAALLGACGGKENPRHASEEGGLADSGGADDDAGWPEHEEADAGEDPHDAGDDALDAAPKDPVCTYPDAGTLKSVSMWVPVTESGAVGDKVDLLFVIDNSGSMGQEQAKLAEQLPRLLRSLLSGVREDGTTFSPVQDLHVGVITTDLGTNDGPELRPSCKGFGDDGVLVKNNVGCSTNAPTGYLGYVPSELAPTALEAAIDDFTCLASVGTNGCGFEQQLEAMYKALAPSTVGFAKGTFGHGDGSNAGFLREDAVLSVIHVSDEDDCSVTTEGSVMFDDNTNHPELLVPGTSSRLGLNIRCAYRAKPQAERSQAEDASLLHDVDRYITEFRENVKPNSPERIVFAAIVGIHEETQDGDFDAMLAHPRMRFAMDPSVGSGDPSNRNSTALDVCRRCQTLDETDCFAQPLTINYEPNPEIITGAKPATRFVRVARGFGESGIVRSICAESYAPAIDAITDRISQELSGTCLVRGFVPNRNGVVACDLLEIMPKGVSAPAACDASRGRAFREFRDPTGKDRRVVCQVNQVAVTSDHKLVGNRDALPGVNPAVGWYYDTFSEEVVSQCSADQRRRVSFHPASAAPKGTTLRLDCREFIPDDDAGMPTCIYPDDPHGGGEGGGDGDHPGGGDIL